MNIILRLIINMVALLVVEYLVPGFEFADLRATVVAVIVIGAVNTFIRPVIHILFLPISILTLGIGAFLVNVALLWLVAYFVPGFEISGFLTAAIASVLLALVSAFFHKIVKEDKK